MSNTTWQPAYLMTAYQGDHKTRVSSISGREIALCLIDPDFADKHEQAEQWAAHIVKCVNEHDELVAVLEWYADQNNYGTFTYESETGEYYMPQDAEDDKGGKARAILARVKS